MVPRTIIDASAMASEAVAVDISNVIYRHLFQIKDRYGMPYRNVGGTRIGHLIGLCNEVSILARIGVKPVFIFDGEAPVLKKETMDRRSTRSARGFELDASMVDEMKLALNLLGIPWVQAPGEAEAQASYMTMHGCWAVITNDYDALLFGASRMVRSLRRGRAEICVLSDALHSLGLDRKGLVEVGLLIGTDYNPGGIRGFGARRSIDLIRRLGGLDVIAGQMGWPGTVLGRLSEAREYFLNPPVHKTWRAEQRPPDADRARGYLVEAMKLDSATVNPLVALLCRVVDAREHAQTKLG